MRDVRDLEVASVGGGAATTPDAVRAACALLVPLLALMALRVWMVAAEWPAFVHAYGTAHHLDTGAPAGWVLAELRTPGQWGVVVDLGAALAAAGLMVALVHRWWGARVLVLGAVGAAGIDVAASLAYPVPWWFVVAGVLAAATVLAVVVLLCRPETSMHLQPEPASLKEFAESC